MNELLNPIGYRLIVWSELRNVVFATLEPEDASEAEKNSWSNVIWAVWR